MVTSDLLFFFTRLSPMSFKFIYRPTFIYVCLVFMRSQTLNPATIVVYFDQPHAFAWSKTIKNTWKWVKKYLFHHAHERHKRGLRRKTKKKVCWSAIGSDSQKLVDTLKLVAHLEFCCFLYFFIFLREPYVSLSCAWWKRYFFTHFRMFLIVFDHAKACVRWSKYTTDVVGRERER